MCVPRIHVRIYTYMYIYIYTYVRRYTLVATRCIRTYEHKYIYIINFMKAYIYIHTCTLCTYVYLRCGYYIWNVNTCVQLQEHELHRTEGQAVPRCAVPVSRSSTSLASLGKRHQETKRLAHDFMCVHTYILI